MSKLGKNFFICLVEIEIFEKPGPVPGLWGLIYRHVRVPGPGVQEKPRPR